MKKPRFQDMSPEEFAAYRPRTEEERVDHEREVEFRAWCKENKEDPSEESVRESYCEIQRECGEQAWDDMDENDREGWEHNIGKSFED
jgi:hypothetical protein